VINLINKLIFIFACFIAVAGTAFAQDPSAVVNRSTSVHVIDGKEYFFHAVLQGQTTYSIARAYGVTVDDIIRENPELRTQNLRFDQIIRIPVRQHKPSPDRVHSTTVAETVFTQHQVKRRETIYGITRMYNITENILFEHNPQARQGLKINMILRIPNEVQHTVYFREYVVLPRQTLFSISREFGVSISELENLNPELKDGLKSGQILRIPVEQTAAVVQPPFLPESQQHSDDIRIPAVVDSYCNRPETKSHYNVALLIPLYLEGLDGEGGFVSEAAQERAFSYLEYYEGIMIALDSVRAKGADIRLTVYDVCDSEAKARGAIWKPEMRNMDLIIGPFFANVFRVVADFALDRQIPIVAPILSDDREILRRYPNMFQVTPGLQTQLKDVADYIVGNFAEDNIILVHNNQQGLAGEIASTKQALNTGINRHFFKRDSSAMAKMDGYYLNGVYIGERVSSALVVNDTLRRQQRQTGTAVDMDRSRFEGVENVKEMVFSRDGIRTLRSNLDKNKRNIVVSLMGSEAIIANYTRQLNQLRDSFDIVVFGVPQWRNYRSVDINYLQRLNTHIFSMEYINYENKNNIDFIKRYRASNHVEPGVMGFRAVETGVFFFSALVQYGSQFQRCIDFINQTNAYNSPYKFERAFGQGGWENQSVFIYRHDNFQLRDVKDEKNRMVTR
jgi:LysM repeat protein